MIDETVPLPILFVDHATKLGGAEHSLSLLLQRLDLATIQPHLACPTGDLAEKVKHLDISWHPINLPPLRGSLNFLRDWYLQAKELAQLAEKAGAGVLYANTVRAAMYTALAAKIAKRPFIWHMRDFWLSENEPRFPQLDWAIKQLLGRAASLIIANSAATARHLPYPEKTTVIHNGIEISHFKTVPDKAAFCETFHIPANAPLVGMVGRLRPWKGQERFIEMAAAIVAAQPETHFVIVGGSPFAVQDGYPEKLQQLTKAKNLTHCLHFTGHLADVRPALAALDIFVHPGEPEPFGLVNIEAMAMGKPVVAFAHGALSEIVVHQETGLLVPPGDVDQLAEAILTLLQSSENRRQLGQAGRQRVKTHFTIQQTAVQITTVLQNLLGK